MIGITQYLQAVYEDLQTYVDNDVCLCKLKCTDIVTCVKEIREAGYYINEGPAFLPYWEHGVEYITILGPNHEVVEFIQKFASEEEKEKAVKALG